MTNNKVMRDYFHSPAAAKVGILYLGRRKVMDGSCPYFKAHSVWPSGFFDTKKSVNTLIH